MGDLEMVARNGTKREAGGEVQRNGDVVVTVSPDVSAESHKQRVLGAVNRLLTGLDEEVCWRCKVWMVIIAIILFIAAVIFTSVALCSVLREDVDDTFDRSSYEIPRNFNGTFRLANQSGELFSASSNQSQDLASQLRQKLWGVYSDSPALGRYFFGAEINDFRNDSLEAAFSLSFLLPRQDVERLQAFTLSRELVYNVLRQFLYDEESQPPVALQIDPASLRMD
ncbi:hypothetical protein CRUP_033510 [Coryphaenoides rupestris]|nr:hypothetical protein CRUP_033510 [Coryphaenoides rupestris]